MILLFVLASFAVQQQYGEDPANPEVEEIYLEEGEEPSEDEESE